jgi:hypothetical protein
MAFGLEADRSALKQDEMINPTGKMEVKVFIQFFMFKIFFGNQTKQSGAGSPLLEGSTLLPHFQ